LEVDETGVDCCPIGEQTTTYGDRGLAAGAPITLAGTKDGLVVKQATLTIDIRGVAEDTSFETVDFAMLGKADPDNKIPDFYTRNFKRWQRFRIELTGTTIDVSYSIDGGVTFISPLVWQTIALTETFRVYDFNLDVASKEIRFRVRNNTLCGNFQCRYYGVDAYIEEEN